MVILIDLDGVIWRLNIPIKGSSSAVSYLQGRGHEVFFFTNNSYPSRSDLLNKLKKFKIAIAKDRILTSAMAVPYLVERGSHTFVVGGPGIKEVLRQENIPVSYKNAKNVVVGLDFILTYNKLVKATNLLLRGANFIGTNNDASYPIGAKRLVPGAGSTIAFLETSSGRKPVIAGKPHDSALKLVKRHIGKVDMVIGDRIDTDFAFAKALGATPGLVASGVSALSQLKELENEALIGESLNDLVRRFF